MQERNKNTQKIAEHVFTGSIAMIGVCLTIIALFRAFKISMATYADEVLSVDTFIFIAATLFSYMALRKNNSNRLESVADILFFAGMGVLVIVGIMIILQTY